MRKTTERLACEMTLEEKLEAAEMIASNLRHIDKLEIEHKILCERFKDDLKQAEASRDSVAEELRIGQKFKDVQVTSEISVEDKVMIFTRVDTGEIIRSRPLTPEELQQRLPGTEEDKAEEPSAGKDKADK